MNAKIFVGTLCLLPCALGAAVTTAVDHPAAARAVQLLEGRTGDAAVRLEVAPALASVLADGYEVRRAPDGTLVVAGARPRALLYAAYEPQRWLGAGDAPVRRVPHFRQRLLNFTGKGHSVADWVAATGANEVHLARNAAGRLVKDCRDADVDCYAFLYGCDPSKWNRGKFAAVDAIKLVGIPVGLYRNVGANRREELRHRRIVAPSEHLLRELALEGIRKVAAEGPTAEQYDKTVKNLEKNIPERRITNSYWMSMLEMYYRYGLDQDTEREQVIEGMTPEKVQSFVENLLSQGNMIKVIMNPER